MVCVACLRRMFSGTGTSGAGAAEAGQLSEQHMLQLQTELTCSKAFQLSSCLEHDTSMQQACEDTNKCSKQGLDRRLFMCVHDDEDEGVRYK